MNLKPFLFIAVGIGLRFVSKQVELQGDAAPLVPGQVSPERLTYHLIALALLVGALGFFIAAGISIYRGWKARQG
jgi:hypothetical protein